MSITHITPINDLKEHEEDGSSCHCNPRVEIIEETGDLMVIHNSYDGREGLELANEAFKDPQVFICKACNCALTNDYSKRTKGYCYLCDPHISLKELLSDQDIPPVTYCVMLGDVYQVTPSGLGNDNYVFIKPTDNPDCENTDIDGNPVRHGIQEN